MIPSFPSREVDQSRHQLNRKPTLSALLNPSFIAPLHNPATDSDLPGLQIGPLLETRRPIQLHAPASPRALLAYGDPVQAATVADIQPQLFACVLHGLELPLEAEGMRSPQIGLVELPGAVDRPVS